MSKTVKGNPVLYPVQGSSGPYGIHSYQDWLRCPRRKLLSDKLRVDSHPLGSSGPMRVGTMFHALMDLAELNAQFDPTAVQYTAIRGEVLSIEEQERVESERLFRAWRAEYYKTPLGTTVETEFVIAEKDNACKYVPFTARMDRIFTVENTRQAAEIKKVYGLSLEPKKLYIQDYKTAGSRDQYEAEKWSMDFQCIAYPLALQSVKNLLYTPQMVISTIYKTREIGFAHFLIPTVTHLQKESLRQMLLAARGIMMTRANTINPVHCLGYRQAPCPFYLTGECCRTNER